MGMRRVILFTLPLLFMMNCGEDIRIKKGEKFEVVNDLREAADIQGSEEYADGFQCNIPKGTILEALYNYSTSASFFECRVIQVNGNANEDYIMETLAPDVIRKREGFETFSLTLPVDYIGTKIKKLNK